MTPNKYYADLGTRIKRKRDFDYSRCSLLSSNAFPDPSSRINYHEIAFERSTIEKTCK